jgi:hypothetical protein
LEVTVMLAMRRSFNPALLVLLVVAPSLAQEPPPDLLGTWQLTMEVFLELQAEQAAPPEKGIPEPEPCVYEGTAEITNQVGAQFDGTAELDLVAGPAACPPMMMASLDGQWEAGTLGGTLNGGDAFGVAAFNGQLQSPGLLSPTVAAKAAPGTIYGGGFAVTSGPFTASSSGSWTGVAQGVAPIDIPDLGPTGTTGLILLLLVGGAWLLVRGRLV